MTSISQLFAIEETIGIQLGHAETLNYVRALTENLLAARPEAKPVKEAPRASKRSIAGRPDV